MLLYSQNVHPLWQAQTLHMLPNTVPAAVPWITPLSCSINLSHHITCYLIDIILAFNMSKPSYCTVLNYHTDRFQSQQFYNLCISINNINNKYIKFT